MHMRFSVFLSISENLICFKWYEPKMPKFARWGPFKNVFLFKPSCPHHFSTQSDDLEWMCGKKVSHCIIKPQTRNCERVVHDAFLSEVTQTPCSNSRPCPDGSPCLEYGGAYLCTCQTSGAELDHKDFYPYGKSLRHQPNNMALCSNVSLHEQLVSIATNTF